MKRHRQIQIPLWIAITVVAALLIAAGVRRYRFWHQERDWKAAQAELDALDPTWRWEQIVQQQRLVPPEQNAFTIIAAIRERYSPRDLASPKAQVDHQPLPPEAFLRSVPRIWHARRLDGRP